MNNRNIHILPSGMLRMVGVLLMACWQTATVAAAVYNGVTVPVNNDYIRTQVGTTSRQVVKEISGLACSRVTPGYLWAEWDEGNSNILALAPDGRRQMSVSIADMIDRDDWEDICTGTYRDIPYIFIGAFGDNYSVWADQYYIVCLPEPAIESGTVQVSATLIRFGFPDGECHNVETLMYDPVDEMFYMVDKTGDAAPTLYHLAMRLDYGEELQRLSAGQKLGKKGDKWRNITAGDISPDGSLIAIKNKQVLLLWTRDGQESVSVTLTRQPEQIGTYEEEEQGEAIAWLDNYTFYTTSDSKNDTPIYMYRKEHAPSSLEKYESRPVARKVLVDGRLCLLYDDRLFTIEGF